MLRRGFIMMYPRCIFYLFPLSSMFQLDEFDEFGESLVPMLFPFPPSLPLLPFRFSCIVSFFFRHSVSFSWLCGSLVLLSYFVFNCICGLVVRALQSGMEEARVQSPEEVFFFVLFSFSVHVVYHYSVSSSDVVSSFRRFCSCSCSVPRTLFLFRPPLNVVSLFRFAIPFVVSIMHSCM